MNGFIIIILLVFYHEFTSRCTAIHSSCGFTVLRQRRLGRWSGQRCMYPFVFHPRITNQIVQISLPGTPDRTRPSSPVRGASSRPLPRPLHLSSRRDLLKALPTEINQRIFAYLPIRDLARCALVSRKWNRSQTINYGNYLRLLTHDFRLYNSWAISLVPAL